MNKHKTAVFVEGQTELVFVRELLTKWFDYQAERLGFDCYALHNNEYRDVAYSFGNTDSEYYYMLVSVGNDSSVLSKIYARIRQLKSLNYQLVIGLRDMYSSQYIKDAKVRKIVPQINRMHIDYANQFIKESGDGDYIRLHFAIMEVEAWLLGMSQYLLAVSDKLTHSFIQAEIGLDLNKDPETSIFHPANSLDNIYRLIGKNYDKHLSDITSAMAKIKKDDIMSLILSGHCATFKSFMETLLDTSFP